MARKKKKVKTMPNKKKVRARKDEFTKGERRGVKAFFGVTTAVIGGVAAPVLALPAAVGVVTGLGVGAAFGDFVTAPGEARKRREREKKRKGR